MAKSKWTSEHIKLLKQLNDQNLSNKEIANILGETIKNIEIVKYRFNIRQRKKWTTTDLLEILRLQSVGMPRREIAKKIGVSSNNISCQTQSTIFKALATLKNRHKN